MPRAARTARGPAQPPAETDRAYDRRRGSASSRGYDAQWRRARDAFLAEPDNALCRMCLAADPPRVTAASVVDHIVPHRGDRALFWDRRNWQGLCETCHNRHKQRLERAAGGRGV